MTNLLEVMPELFTRSELLIWNFAELTTVDSYKNIQNYMDARMQNGLDPTEAFHGQEFYEQVFAATDSRYLIGRYGENRQDILRGSHIEREGRVYHLAVDIFSRDQELVFAPCDGEIVVTAYEPGEHNYGNYLILRPVDVNLPYIFFGHLADDKVGLGMVRAGQQLGRLGSSTNLENGGWSIHLHLQLLLELPPAGGAPIGYSSEEALGVNQIQFPDPFSYFKGWKVNR